MKLNLATSGHLIVTFEEGDSAELAGKTYRVDGERLIDGFWVYSANAQQIEPCGRKATEQERVELVAALKAFLGKNAASSTFRFDS
jgi:hypothetical protein